MLRLIPTRVDDLIDVREAAAILGVARSSVYRAIDDGRLTAHVRDFDGAVRVSRAEVERLARFRPRRRRNHEASNGGAA